MAGMRGTTMAGRETGAKPARDLRIDVVRGLILLVIFANHIPGNVLSLAMPHSFGFTDAADIFVFLAGISAAFAYGGLIDRRGLLAGSLKVGARIWTLYIAHLALFLLVCGLVAAAVVRTQNPLYIETINILPFFNDTGPALVSALMLAYQPHYLDILPLYIVLLAAFPLIYLAARFSPVLTIACSLALWQGAVALGLNLPNEPGAGHWFFNPFAWQVPFTLGIVVGRLGLGGASMPRLPLVDLAAAAIVIFACVVKVSTDNPFGLAVLNDFIENLQIGIDKTNLAIPRVLHLLALAWLFARFVPAGAAWLRNWPARRLAAAGRHSLEVFCVGVVLSILGQIILTEWAFAAPAQLIVNLAGITLLLGLGSFLSWYTAFAGKGAQQARDEALAA